MKLNNQNVHTEHLAHLGIVAGVIKKIGLIDKLDDILPKISNNINISHGQSIAAMILNGLGFTERRLYLVSNFFQNKPVDKYLGNNVKAKDLNDDVLGRSLDQIYKYGTTKLFSEVAFKIGLETGLLGKSAHLDTSTLSVEGRYDDNETEVKITHGYSKDHRQDLKQITLSLTTTGEASFPIWMEALSGNSSDKTSFHKTINSVINFQKDLKKSGPFYWVADSALYSKDKLLSHDDSVLWITRVPESIKVAKELITMSKLNWTCINEKYKFVEVGSYYGSIKQRWVIFESSQAKKREMITFNNKIDNQEKEIIKLIKIKTKERFYSEEEIEKDLKSIKKKYKNFSFNIKTTDFTSKDKKYFKIIISFERDETVIDMELKAKGRFIISTNNIIENISPEQLLIEYKNQSKTEKSFRFLKDDSFLLSDVYLKKPERVQALMVIMCLSLMVYNVGEYLLRSTLKNTNETVENLIKKQIAKPTLKMIFLLMRAVDLVTINLENETKYIVTNFTDNHQKILYLLGPEFSEMYDF